MDTRLLTDIITEQRQKGRIILISTHLLEQVEKFRDHIGLVDRGDNVIDGEFDDGRGSAANEPRPRA